MADNDNDKLALHPVCRSCGCQATGPSASFLNPRTGRTIYIYNGGAVDWCGMEMNKAASVGGLFQFTNVSCWHTHSRRDRNRLRCLHLKVKQTLATGSDLPEVGLRGCERASRAMSRPLTGVCITADLRMPVLGGYCCKSLFASMDTNLAGRTRCDRLIIEGLHYPAMNSQAASLMPVGGEHPVLIAARRPQLNSS